MREERPGRMDVACVRCGRCCQEPFGRRVSPDDLALWERDRRYDLLSALEEERRLLDGDDAVKGLRRLKPCRFNKADGTGRASCVIYEARPRMCREFTPGRSRMCPAGKPDSRPGQVSSAEV